MLSGLTTWAFYDNNAEDCVVSAFGSGCSTVVTQATLENRKGGKRTFLGFFDPSVRPHFEADKLSYTIPMSRFKEMYETMRQSCLFDTHAWGISHNEIAYHYTIIGTIMCILIPNIQGFRTVPFYFQAWN